VENNKISDQVIVLNNFQLVVANIFGDGMQENIARQPALIN
jgi:hypothetical protein